MSRLQEQDSSFATLYSIRCEIIDSGELILPLAACAFIYIILQELQSMNIAARLYTQSTGRIRD